MSDDYGMPVPPGDPDTIIGAVNNLKTLAGDLHGHGDAITGEARGMHAAWPDHNGTRATAGANALAQVARDNGGHVNVGGNALRAFGHKLSSTQSEVRSLIRQAGQADSAAQTAARRAVSRVEQDAGGRKLSLYETSQTWESAYNSHLSAALGPLHAKYKQLIDDLNTQATKSHTQLCDATPGYKKGMSVAQVRQASFDATSTKLPELAQQRGQQLADQARTYFEQGKKVPADLLNEIERYAGNSPFAMGFLETLGPQALLVIQGGMSANGLDDAYQKRVLTDLGDMLAAGTNENSPVRLSDSFVTTLLAPLGRHDVVGARTAFELSQYLAASNAQFGRDFLDRVATGCYALETDKNAAGYWHFTGQDYSPLTGGNQDPTVGLFHAMGHTPLAAQDFFLDQDHLDYYVERRPTYSYPDGGAALGDALRAATTKLRVDGQYGLTGDNSARITQNLIDDIGSSSNGSSNWLNDRGLNNLKPALGDIVTSYIHSVNQSFANDALGKMPDGTPYAAGITDPGNGPAQISFDTGNLTNVLRNIFRGTGDQIYNQVTRAATQDTAYTLMHDLYHAKNFDAADQLVSHDLTNSGTVLGQIFNAYAVGQKDEGASMDHANGILQKVAGQLESLASDVPVGRVSDEVVKVAGKTAGVITGKTLGTAGGIGFDKLNNLLWPTDNAQQAVTAASNSIDPTTKKYMQLYGPEQVDARLDALYNSKNGHLSGVTEDPDYDWAQFKNAFGEYAQKNGISA